MPDRERERACQRERESKKKKDQIDHRVLAILQEQNRGVSAVKAASRAEQGVSVQCQASCMTVNMGSEAAKHTSGSIICRLPGLSSLNAQKTQI